MPMLLLRCKEPELELVEGGFDLRRLNDIFDLRVWIIFNTHLFVTLPTNRDADLQLAGHLSKVLGLRVAHDDPLVQQSVIGLLV